MKKLQFLLQLAVSAICFGVLFKLVQFETVQAAMDSAAKGPLLMVFILMIPAVLVRAWRWKYILRKKSIVVPFGVMSRVTFIGMALNLFLPAGTGDVVRSYYGWQSQGYKEAMLASAVADKVVALFTLCLLGMICGMVIGEYVYVWIVLMVVVPLGIVLFIPWQLPWMIVSRVFTRIFKKDMKVDELLTIFRMDLSTLFGCVLISLIGWVITNFMYYYACAAFSSNADVLYIFTIAPLINLMRIIPITPSGLGSADALILLLFDAMNVTKSEALAASMTINLALIAMPGLIGAVFIMLARNRQKTVHEQGN